MPAPRLIHLNLFAHAVGHHAAAWRSNRTDPAAVARLDYWERLARTAEHGLLDAVFLADGQSLPAEAVRRGPLWHFEPLTLLTALSRATEQIGLVTTVSSSFWDPYHAARLVASLDHISGGRAGVNLVTSMTDEEARNHSMERLPEHAERYARAEEFAAVLHALWGSWPSEATVADPGGSYVDPRLLRPARHRGRWFRVAGALNVPRCPQGRPVVFQAGASPHGRELAARYAEGIYTVAWDLPMAQEFRADVRARVARAGRRPDDVAVMPGLVLYLASTEREARELRAELNACLPSEDALAQLGGFVRQDTSGWRLDEPVPPLPPLTEFTGPQGRYATILRIIKTAAPTVRELLGFLAAGGGHATMIGTPERVADDIERWVDAGGADGFNLMPPVLPDGIADTVEHLVPELQRRGRFRRAYRGATLRDRLRQTRP